MDETGAEDPLINRSTSNTTIFPHKLCRSCLCVVNRDCFWLDGFHLERKLVDMLKDLMSIEIELNDKLPSKLCSTCYDHIIKFDLFKSKVLESQKLLAERLFVIEKTEIEYDEEQDLDDPLQVDENCETEPAIKSDPESENGTTEHLKLSTEEQSDAPELLPKAKRKKRIPKRIVKRKVNGNIASPGKQRRGRRKESCQVCGKTMFAYKIENHLRTHTKEKPFSCEKCGASFSEKSNLNRHVKTHESYRPYRCEICGKGFLRPSSKAIHEITHKMEKDILCPVCGKAFKHHYFLKKHMANIHNKAEIKVKVEGLAYQCPICGQFYRTKSSLGVHKMKHEEPKAFLCNICGRVYSTKAVLDNHQKVHTGEKNFVCSVCNKTFRYKSTLNTHVMVHSGEKPLSCHICNKQFRQHAHLNTHIKGQHSTNRPYQCSFCSKTFKHSCNLIVHTRIHTGETPYRCDVCQKGFYDSSSLKKHKKSHLVKSERSAIGWDKVEVVNSLESDAVH